jgi:RNA polymerase sigma-70 factor (ECF subfamily)
VASSVEGETPGEVSALLRRALEQIRAGFEERTWQAFWRVVVEDQKAVDVAADLQMTVNAVYVAKSRVLGRLRGDLGDLFD